MDMEELSKGQIVLLTLLVSFVTSIATGIVTVSLMDQAPPAISQTVNRIIERTVEKVVPNEGQSAAVVTTEKTVVVKESDLIVEAVDAMTPSLVRVYASTSISQTFLGLGVVLDEKGTIATDASAIGDVRAVTVTRSDGASVRATVVSSNPGTGIALLAAEATTDGGDALSWKPATISVGAPVLGQAVVALSGRSISRIADGLVVALIPAESGNSIIDTNISVESISSGSPLVSTDGSLVGVSTSASRASSQKGFIPASVLVEESAGGGE
jgi:putative serine protease PepD